MEIKVKIHRLFNNDYSNVRAAASMTLDGVLAVHGVKVMTNSKGGTWVSVLPFGQNVLGLQFALALPASSVANLYPFSYSGKTDPSGFYLGRDKYGTNIIVDLDRRASDKTNSSALVIGNSGQWEKCEHILSAEDFAGVDFTATQSAAEAMAENISAGMTMM